MRIPLQRVLWTEAALALTLLAAGGRVAVLVVGAATAAGLAWLGRAKPRRPAGAAEAPRVTAHRTEQGELGIVQETGAMGAFVLVDAARRPLRSESTTEVAMTALTRSLGGADGIPLDSLRIVQHAPTPTRRLTWLELRLDPGLCRNAVLARGGGAPGAQRSLRRAVDLLTRDLADAGLHGTPLDAREAAAALRLTPAPQPTGTFHLRAPGIDGGIRGGLDESGRPTAIGLLGPRPFDALLVGGLWTAQLLALRALATGARVLIETGREELWRPLTQVSPPSAGLSFHPIGRNHEAAPEASFLAPLLLIRDEGPRPARSHRPQRPWQAVLTLLPYLAPGAERLLAAADLVALQRIAPQEAATAARLTALPPDAERRLPDLDDGLTLWTDRRDRAVLHAAPTAAEVRLLGPPRRID